MSTSAALPPAFNGPGAVPAEMLREATFLQNLLQIRDDVLASKHPRIRLPPKVIEQVAPRLPQPISLSRPATNGTQNGLSSQPFPPQNPPQPLPTSSDFPAHTQRPFSTKSASSIDPVLLTKSDHLIRAELQLKRQQIERQLKDQFDKKGRGNDADDREALINVEQYLIDAHLRIPPVSGLPSTTNNSDGAESFDENSYYSSKADSWSSVEAEPNHGTNVDVAGSLTAQTKQSVHNQTLHQRPNESRPNEPTVIDLDEEAYEPADDIEIYESESALLRRDIEEEDYSPPPADIGAGEPLQGRTRNRGNANHGGANGSSRRQSPNGPVPSIQNPRKRRKEGASRRQQQASKRVMRSPEPYIKEEPQSPPFPASADPQPSRRTALQPAFPNDVEMESPREGSRLQSALYPPEPSSRQYRDFDEPSSPAFVRVPQRKVQRDDQDLRRVASLQYARRPYSPEGGGGELIPAPEPRPSRTVSHSFVERPEEFVYREASVRPSGAPRYTPSYEYVSRQQSPPPMAPPPRRIVMDQYGNKYYASPVGQRQSVAPSSRRLEADPFYERAMTQEPTARAPPHNELYLEDKPRRMPPPPRRFVETSDVEMIESSGYRPREASHRPVEVEYRQVSQYEDMAPPREYAPSRAYSMRPEVVRQEIPEGYIRHESMQPGTVRMSQPRYREVSIVHQEPFDERRYVSAPQGRRYMEEGPIEGGQEPYQMEPRRMYTRY